MRIVIILGVCLALGYYRAGLGIAALHRYAHFRKLRECATVGPRTAAVYTVFHLTHHRLIPRKVELVHQKVNLQALREKLVWAIPFMLFNARWTAIRTLIAYQSFQVGAVLLAGCVFGGISLLVAVVGVGTCLIGSYSCFLAYELCHGWTHDGGPLPSTLHSQHHFNPTDNFGMWRWHNNVSVEHMDRVIAQLTRAEAMLFRVPRLRMRVQRYMSETGHSFTPS